MMHEFTPPNQKKQEQTSGLYMDEIDLCNEYFPESAPPAVIVLNMDHKGYLDNVESTKYGRRYRNKVRPISIIFIGMVIVVAIVAIVVVSTHKNNNQIHPSNGIDHTVRVETQLDAPPKLATSPDLSENNTQEDFMVDGGVCVPEIKLHKEIIPESIPRVASDGNTIAVTQGDNLNFYEQDQTQSSVHVSSPQTHERNVKFNKLSDMTLALDGTTCILGDYKSDDETGALYIMEKSRPNKMRHVILAPDDVDDGGMFGFSIDTSKDRLIVGAPYGYGEGSGSAYIYERTDEGGWELGYIFPPDEEDGPEDEFELFGESVAIHKDRAAVSGYNEYDEVTVFIYEYSPLSDTWNEIDDVVVDRDCGDCVQVGVSVSFRDDGGLFISYPRKNMISYLVPTSLENEKEYVLVQTIYLDDDDIVDMGQVGVSGDIMVVGVIDEFDASLVFVYSQSDDDDTWMKVNEIELPPSKNFDPDEDFVDLAFSRSNLMVNYGDDKLLWYTFEGC
eukprot:CCRYP_018163-RA/>CCRYP_018163-RA protein AED:0.23 eAED:0.23 QI:0/-1/0/1/-1/1/1/0/502